VATDFAKNNGGLFKFALGLLKPMQRNPDQGALTSIYLASAPEVEGQTGKYFADCKAIPSDPVSYNKAVAEKLWQVSLEMIV
jgi:hypothetical protein